MLKVLKSSSDLGVDPWEGSKMNRSRYGWATIHDRWELQSEQKHVQSLSIHDCTIASKGTFSLIITKFLWCDRWNCDGAFLCDWNSNVDK